MRFLLISLLAVLLVNIVEAQEEFKGEKVTLGKKKCTCSFMLEVDGDKCSGKGGCDKKCSGSGSIEIGRYSFTLKVKKGKATISKCKAEVESTPLPPTPGSGSGEEPVTMPPAPGSGSGSGPSPPMGEGMQCRCKCNCPDGSGECDCDCNCPMQSTAMTCASGFTRVCPMVEDACPEDMDMICPMNAASRMGGAEAEGTGAGCQCVPDFLMSLVSPGMPPAAGRLGATDREAVEASIKVGKTECKCSFDMAVDGMSCKKSKGRCDKKCSGAAKGVELMDGMYILDMKVKKGKVTIAKCEVTPIALTGTGSGTGSGEGAGGMAGMGSRCACVGKGMGGSGPPPPTIGPVPPTGSGSGPVLPTGGPLPTEGPAPPTGTGSGSGTTAAPAPPGTTAAPGPDDAYVTQAKALIDAGTCDSVSASSVCGDDVTGYYNEFEYNGMRVVVASGAPDHAAEHDQLKSNPNTRCERWQFMKVPLNPAKGSGTATGLGTIGLAVTGGGYFNHLSSPTGSLALANEGPSLDSCLGHSAGGGTYHYHANINCTDAGAATGANDVDLCLKIGYYRDGVPVYGLCKDSSGVQMTSCYSLVSGSTTSNVVTISGTYNVASTNTDYEYNPTSDCNLDEGNGAVHPTTGEYSYFMTTDYPWVPIYYYGQEGSSRLCSLNL